MMDSLTSVWAVDSGAYENNHIDWIFFSEATANQYAAEMNAKAEKALGHRGMDSHYSVSSYKVADSCEKANAEDARLKELYLADREAWLKEA